MTTPQIAMLLWVTIVVMTAIYAIWRRHNVLPISRSLPVVGVLFATALLAVGVQGARMQVVQQDTFSNRSGIDPVSGEVVSNARMGMGLVSEPRGEITDRNGTPLAWSVPTADGFQRVYADPAESSVVGYFSPFLYGSEGLERTLDDALTSGIDRSVTEQIGGMVGLGESRPENVRLTIDAELQSQAQELLGDQNGAIVVIDVKTGAIVAMASSPAVDPTALAGIDSEGVASAREYWVGLEQSGDDPLVRRATQGLYTPGSIFKVITTSAALDSGVVTPDTIYADSGSITIDGRELIEANRPVDSIDSWSVSEGLWYSLNVLYAQVGLDLGADRLTAYADAFGFGESIPLEIPVATSQLTSDGDFLESDIALAESAFGQGQIQVTPLHMAMVAATIANGGQMMEPYLVDAWIDQDGSVIQSTAPSVWRTPISPETASQVERMMIDTVEIGYGSGAAQPGLIVGGKTGTAETERDEPHGWFIGFAGESEPEYAVAVVLEYGGSGAARPVEIGGIMLAAAVQSDASA